MPATVSRHFVAVDGRQVHYRRAGSGPVVAMRHESPRSSLSLVPLVRALAPRFTVIAIDTPGYGLSEPLPQAEPGIADYAAGFAATLDALGVERCAVYGLHTGACIALELAAAHPGRVTGLVLDGLPLFTPDELADLIANYTPEFAPRIDAGHLAGVWSWRRDGHMYFPWYRRSLETRLDLDLSHPAVLEGSMHEGAIDQLRAVPHWSLGYQAGFRYDPAPRLAAASAGGSVPVAVVAADGDVLAPQLDRLPAGVAGLRSEKLPRDHLARLARIGELLAEASAGAAAQAPAPERPAARPGRITKAYAATQYGQLLVRLRHDGQGAGSGAGSGDAPRPLVLLHGSPTSALDLEPLMGALATARPERQLVALDTLGNGDSDKPDADRHPQFARPSIRDYAPVVLEAVDALGFGAFDLYGTHTGAAIAAETAILAGNRVGSVILDGVAMFDEATVADFLASYFIDLTPRWDGTHLVAAWSTYRDSTMWFPWYRRTREHALDFPVRTAEQLQPVVLEFLKSGTTYPLSYRAAFEWDARSRLPKLRARTLLTAHPKDPLVEVTEQAAALVPGGTWARSPAKLAEIAAFESRFLDGD